MKLKIMMRKKMKLIDILKIYITKINIQYKKRKLIYNNYTKYKNNIYLIIKKVLY